MWFYFTFMLSQTPSDTQNSHQQWGRSLELPETNKAQVYELEMDLVCVREILLNLFLRKEFPFSGFPQFLI